MIGGLKHHPDALDRLEGYRKALGEAGIEVHPDLIVEGDFSAGCGVRGIYELLARGASFTAVFAANDATAFGARLAFYRRSLRVPEDVSLVGYDDQAEAAFMAPPLTTVRQPACEMGEESAQALLALIEGEPFTAKCPRVELQVRESVACRN